MRNNSNLKIFGNICQDPRIVNLQSGKKCQVFDLAFHHNGETLFVPVYLYRICDRLKKGDFIQIAGQPIIAKRKDTNVLAMVGRDFILLKSKTEENGTPLQEKLEFMDEDYANSYE